jgi:hypothetical protein
MGQLGLPVRELPYRQHGLAGLENRIGGIGALGWPRDRMLCIGIAGCGDRTQRIFHSSSAMHLVRKRSYDRQRNNWSDFRSAWHNANKLLNTAKNSLAASPAKCVPR